MEQQNRSRRRLPRWLSVLITAVAAVALTAVLCAVGFRLLMGQEGMAVVEGWLLIRYGHVEKDTDMTPAADSALNGMVTGFGDRWSYYMDPEDYRATQTRRANNYVGIGVTVTYEREEGLLVKAVTRDGPAQQAGVLPGDLIVAVDGVSLAGEARYEATDLIQGEEGTSVTLVLLGADGTERTVTCVRATLQNPSALGTMLEGNVGYVQLSNFYSGAADSLREEVEALREAGAEALIFDVRSNPGGYTHELTAMLDYLLPEGPIFVERPRWGEEKVTMSDASCVDLPMVVIVNADSYSAAEIFAAQLRESADVPVVGELTSGKGYYQIAYELSNGGAIGLSTGAYCTGSGHSLIGEGLTPDVEPELSAEEDTYLRAALELLGK